MAHESSTADDSTDTSRTHGSGGLRAPVGITTSYQPALDGIRAVAIAMVMAFHLGYPWMGRGGSGVDLFFVLSGYLITSLLLGERRRTGHIDLRNFYVRRFLRLAPLSILAVVVALVLTEIGTAEGLGLATSRGTALSILLYYSNWWSIAGHAMGPFGHMWSLSVEEQFYFLWPPILAAVIWIGRARAVSLLIGLLSSGIVFIGVYRQLLFNLRDAKWPLPILPGFGFDDIYLGSFLRPDGLLFGCLLAVILVRFDPRRMLGHWVGVVGLAGLVLACATLTWAESPITVWGLNLLPPWGMSLSNLGMTIVVGWLVVVPTSPLARVLSLRPARWIGRRAYGIYLLHPLVFHVLDAQSDLHGMSGTTVRIGTSLVVAGLSYRLLEVPFLRFKERFTAR